MHYVNYTDLEKNVEYLHVKRKNPMVEFHLHSGYEIFFLISGDVNYFVEKKNYPLKYGDLIVTNNNEIHKPSFNSNKLYERITLHFNPTLVLPFSSQEFNLLNCFTNRPIGEQNKISLDFRQAEDVLNLLYKFENAEKNALEGSEILKLNYLIELLVYINRVYMNIVHTEENTNIPPKLIHILDFIDLNLESDLSLEALEKKFYIDKFYLSKMFKNSIGSTIHEYIIYKRIALAKRLLVEGFSVTDTCSKSGFNDYSNFLKMFKRTVGISPGKFKKRI